MFLDILNSSNYINFNITLARVLGLDAAVYCSELMNIYNKAKNKNKIIGDEFFKVDRKYIAQRTTISIDKQLEIDAKWEKIKLIFKHQDDADILKIDTQFVASLIVGKDAKVKEDLGKYLNTNITEIKMSRKKKKLEEMKNSIKVDDNDILKALKDWVDAVGSISGKSKVSPQSIQIFHETLYKYTKGDKEIALTIIKIATVQKYIECQWAINIYERDQKIKNQNKLFSSSRMPKVTTQKVATKDSLGEEIF